MKKKELQDLYGSMELSDAVNEKVLAEIKKGYRHRRKKWVNYALVAVAMLTALFVGGNLFYMTVRLQNEQEAGRNPLQETPLPSDATDMEGISGENKDFRKLLLENTGKSICISNKNENGDYQSLIDLDGDGEKEFVTLTINEENAGDYKASLCVEDAVLEIEGSKEEEDLYLYAISLEKEQIYLFTLGTNGKQSTTHFYMYGKNYMTQKWQLWDKQEMAADIRECAVENGIVKGLAEDPNGYGKIAMEWSMETGGEGIGLYSADGSLVYEYDRENQHQKEYNLTLMKEVPVQKELGYPETSFTMQPQDVKITKITGYYSDLYVEAEDGTAGWVQVEDGKLVDLDENVSRVFVNPQEIQEEAQLVYVKAIDENGVTVDPCEWDGGSTTEGVGIENPTEAEIRYSFAKDCVFVYLDWWEDGNQYPVAVKKEQFVERLNEEKKRQRPFQIVVEENKIVRIQEEYLP